MDNYAKTFSGSNAVPRYLRKLDSRVDRMRHRMECELLRRYARGRLFDCTIGVGRFIGMLPHVTEYRGMDLSAEFVAHVTAAHHEVSARVADLTHGTGEPDDSYDCVICLRTLSAIGHLDTILPDMVRIAKPGGVVVLDYGRGPTEIVMSGRRVVVDGENLSGVLARLDADLIGRIRCDAVLTRVKKSTRVWRFITGPRGWMIPDAVLAVTERVLAPVWWERQILILRKRGAAT